MIASVILLVIVIAAVFAASNANKRVIAAKRTSSAKSPITTTLIAVGDICDPTRITQTKAAGSLIRKLMEQNSDSTLIVLGDLAYPNGSASDFELFNSSWPWAKAAYESGKMLPVLGNHEYREMASTLNEGLCADELSDAVMVDQNDRKYFPADLAYFKLFKNHSGFYTNKVGNWKIIVLDDSCWALPDDTTIPNSTLDQLFSNLRGKQYAWLTSELESSKSAGEFVVGCCHHPSISASGMVPIQTLFETYGAKLMLTGHAHQYARFTTGMTTPIIVTGTGGAVPDTVKLADSDFGILNSVGVSVVDLRDDGTFLTRFVDQNGITLDTFESKF